MGCITSKAVARSMSIREEFNHGFQSKVNDQLFALLSSTNKRRTSLPLETALEEENKYFAINSEVKSNTCDADVEDLSFSRFTRSKSCHTNEILSSSNTGSRSFHTVEEYDALLERIHNNRDSFQDNLSSVHVKLQQSKSFIEDQNDNTTKEDLKHETSSSSMSNFEKEIGWKRKAVAKELKSLDVSYIEFPTIARQRQLIHMESSYITPKFGSYNSNVTAPETREEEEEAEDEWENSVFCTELVAAFEDCMQQLQLEEDNILSHMDEEEMPSIF